ncbi:hypothetical protein EB58_00116 [Enterococcus faecalis]|nr:hypothetical protein EB58_00116 [Enterococcus faecalis]
MLKNIILFTDANDYFDFFQQNYLSRNFKKEYPFIYSEIKEHYFNIKKLISTINEENFFLNLSKILGYDAQLQLIIELLSLNIEGLTEIEIIEISKSDYKIFIKDMCGISINEKPPHSLFFSVS